MGGKIMDKKRKTGRRRAGKGVSPENGLAGGSGGADGVVGGHLSGDSGGGQDGPKTWAYLRVSTREQDVDKFRADILQYCMEHGWGKVEFVSEKISGRIPWRERKLARIVETLGPGDRLVVPEISRLGRSTIEILEVIREVRERGACIYAIKGGWQLDDSIQSKIICTVMAMMAEVERDLISERTREALRSRSAAGIKLGRPAGRPGRSKLDGYEEEIRALRENGATKAFIARRYNTTPQNLANWMKKHGVK